MLTGQIFREGPGERSGFESLTAFARRSSGRTELPPNSSMAQWLIRVGRTKTATTSLAWSEATGFIAQGIDPDATSNMVLGRMRKVVGL